MAIINHAKREINAKIVYYGREGTGKRGSLQYIFDRIKPSLRGELKATSSLFFFDFSPFENPVFGDYRLRFHVYTLPGRVENPAAWKMTLKGADGLVVVTDAASSPESSQEIVSQLRAFLASYGVGLDDLPCILQINKPVSSVESAPEALAAALGLPVQACFADPARGDGVLDVLSRLSRAIMVRIGQDDALRVAEPVAEAPAATDDSDVAAALTSLEVRPAEPVAVLSQEEGQQSNETARVSDTPCEKVGVVLAAEGADCRDGVVRIPLEFSLGGVTKRFVVSIALEQE